MIERYQTPEMREIWSEKTRYQKWLLIEIKLLEVLSKYEKIPKEVIEKLKRIEVDVERIKEIEKRTEHEVIAFIESIIEKVPECGKYFHKGLTSSDVMDTGFSLQIKDALKVIFEELDKLKEVLKDKALKERDTVMAGRTHGIHAEPITLGLKFLRWYDEIKRGIKRLKLAEDEISYGKLSGAVGTCAHISPQIEEEVLKALDLKPEPVASQVVHRDRHAFLMCVLALIASTCEKIATEIRQLQRTEIGELEEPFKGGQKGSSAMPHKKNPVICERICGLARFIRNFVITAMENVNLWNERDISHSSTERIIFPDAFTALHYILRKLNFVISNLKINYDRIKENLEKTGGLIFSGRVLKALMDKGFSRERAYEIVQKKAFEAMKKGHFKELLKEYFTDKELEEIFDYRYYLRNLGDIYDRVIGGGNDV